MLVVYKHQSLLFFCKIYSFLSVHLISLLQRIRINTFVLFAASGVAKNVFILRNKMLLLSPSGNNINESQFNHIVSYSCVCRLFDVSQFWWWVKGWCCTKTWLSHFGQCGPVRFMFYSCQHFTSYFSLFKLEWFQPVWLYGSFECRYYVLLKQIRWAS